MGGGRSRPRSPRPSPPTTRTCSRPGRSRGKDAWGVRLFHRGVGTDGGDDWVGTSHLEVTGDTLDLTTFHDLVCEQAAQLKALGDTDTLEVRKAKAVGVIANRQAALDLGALLGPDDQPPAEPAQPVPSAAKTKLYLHLTLTDLLGPEDSTARAAGFGTVERFGPATIARIKDWAGRSRVTIQPVLDMTRTDAVDAHDPPAWMRELVILRDQHCMFPWCTRDARACDIDHITPYQENGPPGQTRPEALAALCRRHHRAKTFRRWRYHRTPSGDYHWTGPHGQTYLVTPTGTIPIPPPIPTDRPADARPRGRPVRGGAACRVGEAYKLLSVSLAVPLLLAEARFRPPGDSTSDCHPLVGWLPREMSTAVGIGSAGVTS